MPTLQEHERFMRIALDLAREAAQAGEIPVGALVVRNGEILSQARNEREERSDISAHAEILALRRAGEKLGHWALPGCTLYVTLEPCPMCAGAIINSRIPTVVFGARDELTGSCGSVINLFEERYGHRPAVFGSVRAEESARLLKDFFREKR